MSDEYPEGGVVDLITRALHRDEMSHAFGSRHSRHQPFEYGIQRCKAYD